MSKNDRQLPKDIKALVPEKDDHTSYEEPRSEATLGKRSQNGHALNRWTIQ
jgi:hypothetical protein